MKLSHWKNLVSRILTVLIPRVGYRKQNRSKKLYVVQLRRLQHSGL